MQSHPSDLPVSCSQSHSGGQGIIYSPIPRALIPTRHSVSCYHGHS